MKTIKVKEIAPYDFIGSRFAGEKIRKVMDEAFQNGETVTLDFSGVECINQSFGDEILGIFTRAFGVNFIKERVKLENANEKVKGILNWVVKYSRKIHDFSEEHKVIVMRPDIVFSQKISSSEFSS